MKYEHQVNSRAFVSSSGFINHFRKLIRDTVIPYQYEVLHDRVEGVEKSHVVANFINAAKALRGEDVDDGFYGMVFQDSDLAKWIEAASYSLTSYPDSELEKKVDELVKIVAAAQDSDGYLNTYYTIKDRDKRWKNLLEGHELYCAGHMMEAAVAYFDATGKKALLEVMERNVEHIYRHFITDGHEGFSGHPEVELALMKMYRATGNGHCLELAEHFLNVRGVDATFFQREIDSRDWTVWGTTNCDNDYQQSGRPVRELSDATGHSVRAVYLYTGMADLASETDDEKLKAACRRLWDSITKKRMYVTGGIGSAGQGEAFTVDYDLPNDTAYCETCASIGLMFFASRMLESEVCAEYGDIMERAFYNTVLAGISLDGKRFFYVNPLEVIPGVSGQAVTHRHDVPQRFGWHTCACCPPNTARLLSSIGMYAYAENESTAFCHLFAEGSVKFDNGMELICRTKYPYGFTVEYEIVRGGKTLSTRIPQWSKTFSVAKNGKAAEYTVKNGYAYFSGLNDGDKLEITLDDAVYKVYSSPDVFENTGCVAVQRGPLVYCTEGIDNGGDVLSLSLPEDNAFTANEFDSQLLGGVVTLSAEGMRTKKGTGLYSTEKPVRTAEKITAVPYYAWGNRGLTQMRVWITER